MNHDKFRDKVDRILGLLSDARQVESWYRKIRKNKDFIAANPPIRSPYGDLGHNAIKTMVSMMDAIDLLESKVLSDKPQGLELLEAELKLVSDKLEVINRLWMGYGPYNLPNVPEFKVLHDLHNFFDFDDSE